MEYFHQVEDGYSHLAAQVLLQLCQRYDIELICHLVRPVLPMVMRGVPATREKGMYIFSDTVREAREAGVPYGNFYDPIGNPVRRCYSLYPWACQQGRETSCYPASPAPLPFLVAYRMKRRDA